MEVISGRGALWSTVPDLSLALHECWLSIHCHWFNERFFFFLSFSLIFYFWSVHMKYLTWTPDLKLKTQVIQVCRCESRPLKCFLEWLTTGRSHRSGEQFEVTVNCFPLFPSQLQWPLFLVPREKTVLVFPNDSAFLRLSSYSYFWTPSFRCQQRAIFAISHSTWLNNLIMFSWNQVFPRSLWQREVSCGRKRSSGRRAMSHSIVHLYISWL